jgi:hypothetical protein
MLATMIQFILGGGLLALLVWWKLTDIVRVCTPNSKQRRVWLNAVVHVVVGFVVVGCLVDPLIPGSAGISVRAPKTFPTLLDNLRVRIVPTGFLGEAGGNRISYAAFDSGGIAEITSEMSILETRIKVEVFDESQPLQMVAITSVYVSPFVRRQLSNRVVWL